MGLRLAAGTCGRSHAHGDGTTCLTEPYRSAVSFSVTCTSWVPRGVLQAPSNASIRTVRGDLHTGMCDYITALRDHIFETESAASDAAVLSNVEAVEEDFRAKAIEFVRPS